jgi:hypothetical protein
MKKNRIPPALAFLVPLASVLGFFGPSKAVTPEPSFTRVISDGAFEIRDYKAQIIAEVRVPEGRSDPASAGFRPLARYIFGGNQPKANIAMTAPVTRQKAGQSIAMTAPVTRQDGGGDWKVRFIMPEGSSLTSMPAPLDPNVKLLEEPATRYAVIKFSGFGTMEAMEKKSAELRAWLAKRDLKPIDAPIYASYDPPWTPPFLRRNEVWLTLAKPAGS